MPAAEIPLEDFLPKIEDRPVLKSRMCTIIQRILASNLTYFYECKSDIEWHIPHKFSEASAEKSEIVS
jgi:hypothetical protein